MSRVGSIPFLKGIVEVDETYAEIDIPIDKRKRVATRFESR